jgi:hypothetical protein
MKAKLYLESTIPSYYVARPSRDIVRAGQQRLTHDWWSKRLNDFEIFISDTVVDEISAGEMVMAKKRIELLKPFTLLATTDKVIEMAEALIHGGPLPKKAARDATHIALSAVHGMHFLLTWNCTHIANAQMFAKMREICESHGFNCPVICTPGELLVK